jgi:POT family proton-dependent oligopeptide transporter
VRVSIVASRFFRPAADRLLPESSSVSALHESGVLPTLADMKEVPMNKIPAAAGHGPQVQPSGIPRQIRYIIGNEGCERFSFYGMRNILTVFLVSSLLTYLPEGDRERAAKDVFHTFVIGVYFFPLLGGWLADRFFGKYNTILWLSLVYCAGHACLAVFEDNRNGFYAGLALIALGSGGIKPCVSAFVGDQFDQRINTARSGVRRLLLDHQLRLVLRLAAHAMASCGASARASLSAFPGALMFIATVILWLGRKQYVMVPPAPQTRTRSSTSRVRPLASGTAGHCARGDGRGGSARCVPVHP